MPSIDLLLKDIEQYFADHPEGEHHVSQGQQLGVFLKRFQQLKLAEQYTLFRQILALDHPVCDQLGFLVLCMTHTEVRMKEAATQALLLAAYRDNAQTHRARMLRSALRELTCHAPAPTPIA